MSWFSNLSKRLWKPLAGFGAVGVSAVLSACYGPPPNYPQDDPETYCRDILCRECRVNECKPAVLEGKDNCKQILTDANYPVESIDESTQGLSCSDCSYCKSIQSDSGN